MKRILIAGCGDIGGLLGTHYHARGDMVFGLRRRAELLPATIRPIRADLTHPGTFPPLPEGLDLLFITLTAGPFTEEAYQRTYVDGTRNLLAALVEQERLPRRVVFASSTSVYGQQHGEWVDENSPTEPVGFSGACMLRAEQLVLNGGLPGIVVRLGGIYGDQRRALLNRVARGEARLSPDAPRYVNLNHIRDVAGSLIHLGELAEPDPITLATDGHPPDRNELVRWLAAKLGVRPPPMTETADRGRRSESNKRCRNQRLLDSGYRPQFPDYRAGYARTLSTRSD